MNKILEVKNISKKYKTKILDNVSFDLEKGKSLGIVGESGSGKTTICKIITNILKPDAGVVYISGKNINKITNKDLSKKVQMVFQSPYSAINPSLTIKQNLLENLIVHNIKTTRKEAESELIKILSVVSLSSDCLKKYSHELSGGELQRVCIARALLINPEIIILDEVTSSLDATIQKDILDLLKKVQNKYNISYFIVSHNLNIIRFMSNYIAILNNGEIIEYNETEEIFKNPKHEYTKKLLQKVVK